MDYRCVGRSRRRIREYFRPGTCRLAGNVEQILDAHDRAVERSKRQASTRTRIGSVGGCTCGIGITVRQARAPSPFGVGKLRREGLFGGRLRVHYRRAGSCAGQPQSTC